MEEHYEESESLVKNDNNGVEDSDSVYKFLLYKTKENFQEDEFDIEICNEGSLVTFEAEVIDVIDDSTEHSAISDYFKINYNNNFGEQNLTSFEDATRANITLTNVFQQPMQQIKSRKWRKIETPIKTLEGEFSVMQWVFEDYTEEVPIIIEEPVEEFQENREDNLLIKNDPIQLSKALIDNTKFDPDYNPHKFYSKFSADRPEICSFPNCSKKFRDKTGLRKHLKTHGPRLHICAECGKSFLESSKLKRHRLVHTGEQPYPCPWCNKRFALAFNLKTHLRVHTGEKPFGCQFAGCQRRFAQSTNLKYHELTHMRELTGGKGNKMQQIYKIGKNKNS